MPHMLRVSECSSKFVVQAPLSTGWPRFQSRTAAFSLFGFESLNGQVMPVIRFVAPVLAQPYICKLSYTWSAAKHVRY